ncbi:MAG TPA: PaaI family thioesterase [Actinomycetota bacterium]|nr:PaaI family thioesterase [Actinomycetota bacterium]
MDADYDAIRQRVAASPYHRWMGAELVDLAPGLATMRLEIAEHHLNPWGIVHGGVLAGLLDSVCGLSLRTLLPPDRTHRTIQMSVTYLKGAGSGHLVGRGRAVNKGRSLGHADGEVYDAAERLLARATATFMTVPASSES